jgi:uncharacterized protein with PIN domain
MLYSLNKQIAHCYSRAVECRELAALAISPADRQFYTEREQGWLTLARSYEFQERLNGMIRELKRQKPKARLPPTRTIFTATEKPPCPTCKIEMVIEEARPARRTFGEPSVRFHRLLFVCPGCRRMVDQLAEIPDEPEA